MLNCNRNQALDRNEYLVRLTRRVFRTAAITTAAITTAAITTAVEEDHSRGFF